MLFLSVFNHRFLAKCLLVLVFLPGYQDKLQEPSGKGPEVLEGSR